MNHSNGNQIVEIIGSKNFEWLTREFNKETRLRELPDEILDPIASVDITIRDYSGDRKAITSIALITFAYRMADKIQHPKFGSNDILLLKILAKSESQRRKGGNRSDNEFWDAPLFELITGEIGERIRATRFMTNPK